MPTLPDMRLASDRRAGGDRLDDDVRAAFHARRDDQQVRALDRLPRPRVRARAQPLHARIVRGERRARRRPSAGSSAAPMIVSVAGTSRRQPAPRGEHRAPDPSPRAGARPARNAGGRGACAANGTSARADWIDDARLVAHRRRQVSRRIVLQHDQRDRPSSSDDSASASPAGRSRYRSVPVSATTSARSRRTRAPRGDRRVAAPRVQRDHRHRVVARGLRSPARRALVESTR